MYCLVLYLLVLYSRVYGPVDYAMQYCGNFVDRGLLIAS
jgi:hypothetical protein